LTAVRRPEIQGTALAALRARPEGWFFHHHLHRPNIVVRIDNDRYVGEVRVALTFVVGVAEPLPIALFAAGACFFGALLITDPHRGDRVRTVGWAAVVSAVAVVVTVELSRTAVWAAAAFLILQMFLSYALSSWSPRAGNLAVIGALTTFLAGAGHLFSQNDVDQLRVALHSAQKGLEDMADQADVPDWMRSLPDQIVWSISSTLHALAAALRDDVDEESRDAVARRARVLRSHIHEALTHTTKTGEAPFPPEVLLAALTLLAGGEILAQSVTQARKLAAAAPKVVGAAQPNSDSTGTQADTSSPPDSQTLSPTLALAIQAVVAAVTAGLLAKAVGNEQSLVVAWTAFVVIAGSAGLSTRRAWVRLPATILGAVGGVAIAAFVPDNLFWTVAVVAVGVFFTIVSAPVSYPAMVFWMSIAFVPLFATEGRYLDLITDKTVAALIGGCVAAVVALTIVPIRTSREIRPAVLTYLDALDEALESHLPGRGESVATTQAELDRAHAALAATAASAATETNVFAQPERVMNSEAIVVDAVHEAYLRLTPLLSDSSRILHGWTDDRVETGIHRLRDAVQYADAAARGDAAPVTGFGPTDQSPPVTPGTDNTSLQLADSLRRVEDLAARLTELAQVFGGHSGVRAPTY
jgi:uncharacterized membrane protein YccC